MLGDVPERKWHGIFGQDSTARFQCADGQVDRAAFGQRVGSDKSLLHRAYRGMFNGQFENLPPQVGMPRQGAGSGDGDRNGSGLSVGMSVWI